MSGGTITDAGIGLTALGVHHFHSPEAEAVLIGKVPTDELIAAAGAAAAAITNPPTDQRGPADYKRHLANVLTQRAIKRAIARAASPAAASPATASPATASPATGSNDACK